APYDAGGPRREIACVFHGGVCGLGELDSRHKAIAASGNRGYISVTWPTIAQCSAEGSHMNLKIALLDDGAGPYTGHECALANQLTGMLDQRDQDLERTTAETNRGFTLKQKLLCGKKTEGPEREGVFSRGSGPGGHPCTSRDGFLVDSSYRRL